jgi:hypothetical protein
MADGFVAAVRTVAGFRFRKGQPAPDTSGITWGHAIIGIGIALAIQLGLLAYPLVQVPAALPVVIELGIIAVAALAVPFVVIGATAGLTRRAEKLPATFLYLAFCLVLMELALFALSFVFDSGRSSAGLGVLAVFCYFAARHVLGVSSGVSVLAALLVVVGTLGVGFLLLALPTGQAMLAAR